jgi:hypothetical protein
MSGTRYRLPEATWSEQDELRSQNRDVAGMDPMALDCELWAVYGALVDIELHGLPQRTVWVGRFPVRERCWLTTRVRILRSARQEHRVAR